MGSATIKVARFHTLVNAGDFDKVVQEVDPTFKWPRRGPSFEDYLAAAHRKLGYCGNTKITNYSELMTRRGRVAQLQATVHCDRDDAQESFLFYPGRGMKISGYTITSPVLIAS